MKPLDLLREADAGRGASPYLETRLRAAYRERQTARRRARWLAWAGAVAGCAVVLIGVARLLVPVAVEAPKPPVIAHAPPPSVPAPKAVVAVRRHAPRKKAPAPAETARVRTEEFLAIPYAPPFTAQDRGEVVRMAIPRQSIRSLGIPVNPERMFERVPADVLLGEDGIPRAIRLVRANDPL